MFREGMWADKTIRFEGREWKVVASLEKHLMVIPNNGMYPACPVLIPQPPEIVDRENNCAQSPDAMQDELRAMKKQMGHRP